MFVESDRRAAAVLERNIATLGLPGATLRRGAGGRRARRPELPSRSTSCWPTRPTRSTRAEVEALLTALTVHGWVRDGSVAVVERAAGGPPLNWPDGWDCWQPRVYGDTRLELAERR